MKRLFSLLFAIILLGVGGAIAAIDQKTPPQPSQKQLITQNLQASPIEDPQKGVLGGCDDGSRGLGNGTSVATQKSPDGMYESTGFGCYVNGKGERDESDTPGCNAACGPVPGECNGLSNEECMYKVKWFAANSDQYGCFNRVKVTNPANGKAVVVVIYDVGPACSWQPRTKVFDMSYPTVFYLGVGNYQQVKVEEVSKDTPLGPTDGSDISTPNTGTDQSGSGIHVNLAPLKLMVQPKKDVKDMYIINKATATAIGTGADSFSGTGTAPPGQPIPSGNVADIQQKLCNEYRVCATVNTQSSPDQGWTLPQMTALWNVVQRIYQSPRYQSLAMGGEVLEISRAACYPQPDGPHCDRTWGYYAGHVYTNWNTLNGSRLVVMTNNVPKDGPVGIIEWVMAHEIGHSASIESVNAGVSPSQPLIDCNQSVSNYAQDNVNNGGYQEYVAEAISYYMTVAEEVHGGYKGGSKNMKQDFSCIYDAAKREFFAGVEY